VAYLVPWLLAPVQTDGPPREWTGLLFVALGSALLLACVREFYVAGKGTLAPWSPPSHLVTSGLYRWSRNPMYVAVTTVLLGWALWYLSVGLLVYALVVVVLFHLRVVLYEEPRLAAGFGEEWSRYRARVRRWL
jgi:protein-S-isoprenylcysteine O-methyltransferase Ste14